MLFKKDVAVLEFGSSKISVLVGERLASQNFNIKASGEAEYAGFMDGEFIEPNSLKAAVMLAVNNAEIALGQKIKSIYIGVPAEFVFCECRELTTTFLSTVTVRQKHLNKLFNTVSTEEKKGYTIINKAPIFYKTDTIEKITNPIGQKTKSLYCFASFIMAEDKFYALLEKILYEIGIYSFGFISSTMAASVYLLKPEQREDGAILIDCGYITTAVASVLGDGLTDLKSFSAGGGHITSDLHEVLKIPFNSAEQIKRKLILSLEAVDTDVYEAVVENVIAEFKVKVVNEIVFARIDMLADNIKKAISVFSYKVPDTVSVYLTGGGLSYIRGIKEYLSKELAREVNIVVPEPMQYNKPNLSSEIALMEAAIELELTN